MELLFMEPVFKEAIWGGTKLRDVFGYEIPGDTTGECWAVSAHKNGDCRIAGGMYDGRLLRGRRSRSFSEIIREISFRFSSRSLTQRRI